jgi:hypothetical protein
MEKLARIMRREREAVLERHCEERSDEAIQFFLGVALDCFAPLAMTMLSELAV